MIEILATAFLLSMLAEGAQRSAPRRQRRKPGTDTHATPEHPPRWMYQTHRGEDVELLRIFDIDLVRAHLQSPPARSTDIVRRDTGYQTIADYEALRRFIDKNIGAMNRIQHHEPTQRMWIWIPSPRSPNYATKDSAWKALLERWPAFLDPELHPLATLTKRDIEDFIDSWMDTTFDDELFERRTSKKAKREWAREQLAGWMFDLERLPFPLKVYRGLALEEGEQPDLSPERCADISWTRRRDVAEMAARGGLWGHGPVPWILEGEILSPHDIDWKWTIGSRIAVDSLAWSIDESTEDEIVPSKPPANLTATRLEGKP
jgi:hypothetical protein